ncbi:MAG: 50S ribosomal protein L17 [candidate division Zixibacteria bacterium CG_4_9_14_3_um_filter_46_8]|nr:MAG: 50S ribosomal protein L17 [candidate division Zixibacteria bacterium CG_4_9_14_3_um_filter_46_8]
MRHNRTVRKLGVKRNHRLAMMRNMVTSLLDHGRVTTTDSRAKVLKSLVDGMITKGKSNTVHARRMANQTIRDRAVLKKLFNVIAVDFSNRNGGYTRIVKWGHRKGDNASLSLVELVNYKPTIPEESDKKKGEKAKAQKDSSAAQ